MSKAMTLSPIVRTSMELYAALGSQDLVDLQMKAYRIARSTAIDAFSELAWDLDVESIYDTDESGYEALFAKMEEEYFYKGRRWSAVTGGSPYGWLVEHTRSFGAYGA